MERRTALSSPMRHHHITNALGLSNRNCILKACNCISFNLFSISRESRHFHSERIVCCRRRGNFGLLFGFRCVERCGSRCSVWTGGSFIGFCVRMWRAMPIALEWNVGTLLLVGVEAVQREELFELNVVDWFVDALSFGIRCL